MKAKLILWFVNTEELVKFLSDFIKQEPSLTVEIYSAVSYKVLQIPDITAYTLELNGQLQFSIRGREFTIGPGSVLRQEIKFNESED